MRAARLSALLVLSACARQAVPAAGPAGGEHASTAGGAAVVRPGIDVFLADVPERLRGRRVALITNHSGIDRERRVDIDLLRGTRS